MEYEVAEPYDDSRMQDVQQGYAPPSPYQKQQYITQAELDEKRRLRQAQNARDAQVFADQVRKSRQEAERWNRFATSMIGAKKSNPDDEARIGELAEKLGTTPDMVRSNRSAAEHEYMMQQLQKAHETSPAVAQFLSDPDNARVAHDDVENLSAMDMLVRTGEGIVRALPAGLFGGLTKVPAGTVSAYARNAAVASELEQMSMNPEAYAMSADAYGKKLDGIEKTIGDTAVVKASDAVYNWAQETQESIMGERYKALPTPLRGLVFGTQSMGEMAGGFALSVLTGSPMPALAFGGLSEGTSAYMDDIQAGRGIGVASLHGVANAAVEVGTELLGIPFLGRTPIGKFLEEGAKGIPLWKRAAKGYLREIPGESLATQGQLIGDVIAENMGNDLSMTGDQYVKAMSSWLEQAPEAALETLFAVAPMSLGFSGMVSVRRIRSANRMREVMQEIQDKGNGSKLKGRSREVFRKVNRMMVEGTPLEKAQIDAEDFTTYFQGQGIDPRKAAADFGVGNYDEAVASGGKILMPYEDWVGAFSENGHAEALLDTTTLNETVPSIKDAALHRERVKRILENNGKFLDVLNETAKESEQAAAAREAVDRITSVYQKHLEATGMTPETALTQAKVAAAFHVMPIVRHVESLAKEQGREVAGDEIARAVSDRLSRYDLRIDRTSGMQVKTPRNLSPQLDSMLATLRAGRMPSAHAVYGKTLTQAVMAAGGLLPTDGLRQRVKEGRLPKRLLRKKALGADVLAADSRLSGYMRSLDTQSMQADDALIEALEAEHSMGEMTYDAGNLNGDLLGQAVMLGQLADDLGRAGIDLNAVTDDAEVRRLLSEFNGDRYGEQGEDSGAVSEAETVDSYGQRGFVADGNATAAERNEANRQYDERKADLNRAEEKLKAEAKEWSLRIDALLAAGKIPSDNVLMLKQTPLALYLVGANFGELYASPHFFDGLFPNQKKNPKHNRHLNMTADLLKQIPEALTDPIAVFNQDNGRPLFMLDLKDTKGATIIVPVELNITKRSRGNNKALINIAATAFAKNDEGREGAPRNDYFFDLVNNGKLAYVNRGKATAWQNDVWQNDPAYKGKRKTVGAAGANSLWSPRVFRSYGTSIKTDADLAKLKGENTTLYQSAYHGTPHRFDKFSVDNIGTGEGAQAHGWGLYFAQDKDVSEEYRKRLSREKNRGDLFEYPVSMKDGSAVPDNVQEELKSNYGIALADSFDRNDIGFLRNAIERSAKSAMRRSESDREYAQDIRYCLKAADGAKSVAAFKNAVAGVAEQADKDYSAAYIEWGRKDKSQDKAWKQKFNQLMADARRRKSVAVEVNGFIDEARQSAKKAGRRVSVQDVVDAAGRRIQSAEDTARQRDELTAALLALDFDSLTVSRKEKEPGQLFEVDIPENDVLLDEDKPLSEQPVAVRQAIYDWYASHPDDYILPKDIDDLGDATGEAFYKEVAKLLQRKGAKTPYESQRAASLELNRLGIKGITYDGQRDGRCFVVFDDNAITVLDTFYQNQKAEQTRGAFSIGPNRTFRIELMAKANFSTFAHESAHFQLEMLSDMVSEPDASDYIKQEWQTICDYLGGDIRTLEGDARTEAHERFARSFEAYLMEGKAPSAELKTAFRRFKDWMIHIYKVLRNLDVKLSDDIRRVFDRMLASDAQIEQAALESGMRDALVTAENLGLSEGETKALKRLYAKELADADDRLRKRMMKSEVRKAQKQYKEELKKAQKQAEQEWQESNLVYVGGLLTNQDDRTLALNEAELVRAYGKDYLTKLPKFDGKNIYAKEGESFLNELAEANNFDSSEDLLQALEKLPPKDQWIAQRAQEIVDTFFGDTVNAAEISDAVDEAMNNDPKGERLKGELVLLRKAAKAVEVGRKSGGQERVQKLRERYEAELEELRHKVKEEQVKNRWDIAEADLMQAIAVGKVKSQYQERVRKLRDQIEGLKAEKARARDESREARREAEDIRKDVDSQYDAMRVVARQVVSEKLVKDVKPHLYLNAAHKAMRGALAALNKANPDYAEAARLKQKEVFSFHLYREARAVRRLLENGRKKMQDIASRSPKDISKKREMSYVYKAQLIARSLLGRNTEQVVDRIQTEVERGRSDPFDYDVGSLREISVQDALQAISDANEFWESSLRESKILAMGKLVDMEMAGGELKAELDAFGATGRVHNRRDFKKDLFQKGLGNFITSMIRMESWCDMVGGGKVGDRTGSWSRYIFNPIKEAAQNARAEQTAYLKELADILAGFNFTHQTVEVQALNGFVFGNDTGYARMEIAHAFLHCGNRSNFERLIIGRGWGDYLLDEEGHRIGIDDSRWKAAVKELTDKGIWTEEDMDRVQRIWDLMAKLTPKLQEAYKRVNGRFFDEIRAEPFEMFGKTYAGGYAPAVYDPHLSDVGQKQEVKPEDILNASGSFLAKLGDGFGVTRVKGVPGPLLLDLSKIGSHFNQQVLFANMAPTAVDVGKLLRSKGVQDALRAYDPMFYQDVIVPWYSRAVTQDTYGKDSKTDAEERLMKRIRSRAGIAAMFFNVVNAVEGFFDLTAAYSRVKAGHLHHAFGQILTDRKATLEKIFEMSPYMRERLMSESNEAMNRLDQALHPSRLKKVDNWINDHAYFLQEAVDGFTAPVVFLGAYNQAVAGGLEHAEAVSQAESVVRSVYGTMMPEDLANREAGGVWKKLFTQFTGYFVQRINLIASERMKRKRDIEGKAKQCAAVAMLYGATVFLPAWIGATLRQFAAGSDDENWSFGQWLINTFGWGTVSYAVGLGNVTLAGRFASAGFEALQGNNMASGRIFSSPATQLFVTFASNLKVWDKDGNIKGDRILKVLTSGVNMVPIVPVVPNRPVASLKYLYDVGTGEVSPVGVWDFTRGAVTGRASKDSR